MPYIKQEDRKKFVDSFMLSGAFTPGELNYQITRVLLEYWNASSRNYQAINDIVGVLEGAKLEFYRRLVVPYEDKKIKENGDVYTSYDPSTEAGM
jgi:hypothetical protein